MGKTKRKKDWARQREREIEKKDKERVKGLALYVFYPQRRV